MTNAHGISQSVSTDRNIPRQAASFRDAYVIFASPLVDSPVPKAPASNPFMSTLTKSGLLAGWLTGCRLPRTTYSTCPYSHHRMVAR